MNSSSQTPFVLTSLQGWMFASVVGILLASACSYYVFLLDGSLVSLASWGRVAAATSAFLFAFSLGAGGCNYYLGFPNMRAGYQKYLGELAFWVALLYAIMLLFINPEFYAFGLLQNLGTADVAFGLSAMFIFGAMVVVTKKPVVARIGKDVMLFVLGLGYFAYGLLVMRAIFIEWDIWVAWFATPEGVPPTRIILSLVATAILFLRISIPIHKKATQRSVVT